MQEIDIFSKILLEESKRFLEKADDEELDEGKQAYLHSALVLGYCALEAYINSIADELLIRTDFSINEISILSEKEIEFVKGEFQVGLRLKMYRIEDRIQFLFRKFSNAPINKDETWWTDLKAGMNLRNQLTHPKTPPIINLANCRKAIDAVIVCLDKLFKIVYKVGLPVAKKGLDSKMTF